MNAMTRRSPWLRTVLVLLALVLGAGASTVVATPAVAGHPFVLCFPIFSSNGQQIGWECRDLPVEKDPWPDWPDWAIGFEHTVLPADPTYVDGLANGLELLGQAALADRRAEAASLRGAAQEEFLGAAERLGEARVRVGEVGVADLENNRIEPTPDPWLAAAGADLADGLTLLQGALANPDPQPWLGQAMAQFDQAYQELATQEVSRG